MRQRTVNEKTKLAAAADLVATRSRLKRAVDRLVEHLRDPENFPEPRLHELGLFNDVEVNAIWTVARKQTGLSFSERHFVEAMRKTTPVLARPRISDRVRDMWRVLAQPEITEKLWPLWNSRTGRRGPDPGYLAKALLVMTALMGTSAHFDDNHEALTNERDDRWRSLFDWIEQTAAAAKGRLPQPYGHKVYEKACEQINLITDAVLNPGALTSELCGSINLELCDWLRSIYPEFGKHLAIDGMLVKGWVRQVKQQEDSAKETKIRRRAPNASAKYIGHGNGGFGRFARGYFLVVLCDLATGVPVAWRLLPAGSGHDGSADYSDALALRGLLTDLFDYDETFPVETIVADRAWNSYECVRDCAVNWGIHLLSGLDEPTKDRKLTIVDKFDSGTIGAYDGIGNVYCRQHGALMNRSGSDFVGRKQRAALGMKPGDPAPEGKFRLRFTCPIGGGPCDKRAGFPMSHDWNNFSYYPHAMDAGWEEHQAFRIAMYCRRNTCEGIFGALKLGHKLGLESADRTHTANEATLETLLSLALLLRTALVTANERILRGEMPEDPPPDLLAKLG